MVNFSRFQKPPWIEKLLKIIVLLLLILSKAIRRRKTPTSQQNTLILHLIRQTTRFPSVINSQGFYRGNNINNNNRPNWTWVGEQQLNFTPPGGKKRMMIITTAASGVLLLLLLPYMSTVVSGGDKPSGIHWVIHWLTGGWLEIVLSLCTDWPCS